MSEGNIEIVGTVVAVHGNNNFLVEIELGEEKRRIMSHLSGRMRRFKINVIPGDRVTMDLPPPFDKGRITFRGEKE